MLHKSPVQFYIPTIPLIIVKENKIIRLRTYKLDKKKILKNRTWLFLVHVFVSQFNFIQFYFKFSFQ
jgi:hypothetical protein